MLARITFAILMFASITAQSQLAPLFTAAEPLEGEYFVVFKGKRFVLPSFLKDKILTSYQIIPAVLVHLDEDEVLTLRQHPNISAIEQNGSVHISLLPWGLDRIDQRTLPLDKIFAPENRGEGVHVYVIDSGIRKTHMEFSGRLGDGASFVDDPDPDADCLGHGTHVAGTVGGQTVGVANATTLHSLRIFACNGSTSWGTLISAIDWMVRHGQKPAVANMSISGGISTVANQAVNTASAAGFVMVAAAGNDNVNACSKSPASATSAISVGASTVNDARAAFSNWGSCVKIFAPGASIISASYLEDSSYRTLSGTSMASPHAAGAAAVFLSKNPQATPLQVATWLTNGASNDKLDDPKGAPNLLLFVGARANARPVANAGPDLIAQEDGIVKLDGGASHDPDGKIVSYEWRQSGGPATATIANPNNVRTSASGLEAGKGDYVFSLKVTDDGGLDAVDEVNVHVNQAPKVTATIDGRVRNNAVNLKGTAVDVDGTVQSVVWVKIKGKRAKILHRKKLNTRVTGLQRGVYQFRLQARDDMGGVGKALVTVRVN